MKYHDYKALRSCATMTSDKQNDLSNVSAGGKMMFYKSLIASLKSDSNGS